MALPSSLRALVVGVALISACTGDDGEASASGSTAATEAPPATAAPAPGAPEPSPGCGAEGPPSGRSEVTLSSGGRERTYVRYVPAGAEPGTPMRLIVDFTAYSPASLQERISGLTQPAADGAVPADEQGVVVVTPEPVGGDAPLLTWNLTDQDGWADDDLFVDDLLADVRATTCVEAARVVVTGFAIGGVMASRIACTHAEEVTALIAVAGLDDPPGCDPDVPVPVLTFHGTEDPMLPLEGGTGPNVGRLGLGPGTSAGLVDVVARRGSVTETVAAWAERNGCEAPVDIDAPSPEVERRRTTGCDQGATVELITIQGGGHTWPGSVGMDDLTGLLGPVSDAIDANEEIWAFLAAHAER